MPDPNDMNHQFGKIIPANLTANADYFVEGNPVTSRPESGVDNSYPGLEFDIRNIDKAFFPGLRFEFYRSTGANLVGVSGPVSSLIDHLLQSTDTLYLWAMVGRVRVDHQQPDEYSFRGQDGLSVWRRVHDLLPGRVAIAIGPSKGFHTEDPNLSIRQLQADLRSAFSGGPESSAITRLANDGSLQYLVLVGERAEYLDDEGVIDPEEYRPGDLTKTLCAPWMYDFRDCGCFYWASNKPDVVQSEDGNIRYMNFLRKDRTTLPNESDERVTNGPEYSARRNSEMSYADLLNGAWEDTLPIVLNDREGMEFTPDPGPGGEPMLTPEEAAAELRYLASVEHALVVQYLYARYSLNDDTGNAETDSSIRACAQDLFQVALDEMRHLRWANHALNVLGQPPTVDRADVIGKAPEAGSGRKQFENKQYLDRPFQLNPLNQSTLQWFIDVERPSQMLGDGIDGMYVELLRTFSEDQTGAYPEAERLVELMKLIVDEGEGHFKRFVSIQQTLQPIGQDVYLHDLTAEPDDEQKEILDLADLYYEAILKAIHVSFSLGDQSTGRFIRAAVRSMESLHEIGRFLASQNVGLRFTLPVNLPAKSLDKAESHAVLADAESKLKQMVEHLMKSKTPKVAAMADRHQRNNQALFLRLHQIIEEDYPQQ